MPFLATLPGNDQFPKTVFEGFFEKLEESYYSDYVGDERQNHLEMLMHWLADQTSPELALQKVSHWPSVARVEFPIQLVGRNFVFCHTNCMACHTNFQWIFEFSDFKMVTLTQSCIMMSVFKVHRHWNGRFSRESHQPMHFCPTNFAKETPPMISGVSTGGPAGVLQGFSLELLILNSL